MESAETRANRCVANAGSLPEPDFRLISVELKTIPIGPNRQPLESTYEGKPEGTRKALQDAKRRLGAGRGFTHYDKVPDAQLTDAFHYTLFPNFAVSLWSDGFHFLRARPHPDDPQQCLFDNWWYASPATLEAGTERNHGGSDEVERTLLEYGSDLSIGPGIEDDVRVFVTQQRGFRSRGFKGVYLAKQESRIRRYHELIDDYIEGRMPK